MRTSDKRRREIAHELRAMVGARCYGRPGATGSCVDIDDFLTVLLDRRVRDCEVSIDSTEALRVADLIDVPTCRNVYDENEEGCCENGFKCSKCGELVEDCEGYRVKGTFNYCPNCGAEVVPDGC